MLTDNLHITFSLVWMIVVANIAVAVALLFLSNQVAKIAFVPGHLIVPGVVTFVFMGSWLGGSSMGDWITCLVMGIVGFVMKRGGWPRPPLILALILGNILENSFQISMRVGQGWSWLSRPIVLIILALIVITLIFAVSGIAKKKQQQAKSSKSDEGEGSTMNPLMSLPFATLLAIMFIWAGIEAQPWHDEVKQFPVAIAYPAAIMAVIVILYDTRDLLVQRQHSNSWSEVYKQSVEQAILGRSVMFFGYLVIMILLTFVIGQKLSLAVFSGIYLWRWGGYSVSISILYAVGVWIVIVGFYDRIMNLLFHPSWLNSWLYPLLPNWMPPYLF